MLIADLQYPEDGSSTITLHDTEVCKIKDKCEILGYHLVSDYGENVNSRYTKAILRGRKLALKAAEMLSPDDGCFMKVNRTGLVGGMPSKDDKQVLEDLTFYGAIGFKIRGPTTQARPFSTGNYLHFSSPQGQFVPVSFDRQRITINTGVCLFSAKVLESSLFHDGKIDPLILQDAPPTLYEVEYIARAAPAVANFVALLQNCNDESLAKVGRLKLCIDVPSFHYYHSVHERLLKGSCTFMKALHWMTAVKNRSTRIANIFQSHVFHMLTQRGFSPMALDVEKSPSSVQICAEICGELSKGILPDLDSVLESLSVKESGWARLMEMVPDKEKPYDWRSFGYLFYVFQILKPALGDYKAASDDRTAGNDSAYQTAVPRLMVGIDDNVERRIYSRAQKFLKALRSSKSGHQPPHYLLEVYMCRRIFIDGNMDGSNLYLSDPSPIRPSLNSCEQRSVHAAYDGIPACHARLSPFDVAERLHNIDDIKVLKKQFSQEGFLCH